MSEAEASAGEEAQPIVVISKHGRAELLGEFPRVVKVDRVCVDDHIIKWAFGSMEIDLDNAGADYRVFEIGKHTLKARLMGCWKTAGQL